MWYVDPARPIYRVLFAIAGAGCLVFGLMALKYPLLLSRNPWGAMALGPFAILFGLIMILGAVFKPGIFK
jgi:hypothetical protein